MDDVHVFTDLATPAFAPMPGDMLGFSALHIGLTEPVLIDDVAVALPEPRARSSAVSFRSGSGGAASVR